MNDDINIKTFIERIIKKGIITEKEINVIKVRLNGGDFINLSSFFDKKIYLTDEHALKELAYLRKLLLTESGHKLKNCSWDNEDLFVIGYAKDDVALKEMDPRNLISFFNFQCICLTIPRFTPIYEINGIAYYILNGKPKILWKNSFNRFGEKMLI